MKGQIDVLQKCFISIFMTILEIIRRTRMKKEGQSCNFFHIEWMLLHSPNKIQTRDKWLLAGTNSYKRNFEFSRTNLNLHQFKLLHDAGAMRYNVIPYDTINGRNYTFTSDSPKHVKPILQREAISLHHTSYVGSRIIRNIFTRCKLINSYHTHTPHIIFTRYWIGYFWLMYTHYTLSTLL